MVLIGRSLKQFWLENLHGYKTFGKAQDKFKPSHVGRGFALYHSPKPRYRFAAFEIITIICQAESVPRIDFNLASRFNHVDRIMDVMFNEIVNADLHHARHINQICLHIRSIPLMQTEFGHRYISILSIKPPVPIVTDMLTFNRNDIQVLIATGEHVPIESRSIGSTIEVAFVIHAKAGITNALIGILSAPLN